MFCRASQHSIPFTDKSAINSQVRAGSIQELVYKQGQAGVTKATVTVVFSNPDPNNSPIGYESKKQITVTRQVCKLHSIYNSQSYYQLTSRRLALMHRS